MRGATRSLFARAGVGLTANVVQRSALRFSKVVVDSPALILVRHGTKSLRCGGQRWTLEDGDAIAIAGGQSFDVSNRLSAAQLYEARWLVWDRPVIEQFALTQPAEQPLKGAQVLKQVGTEFVAALERAVAAVADPSTCPDEVARHRLAELLVWLSLAGVRFAPQRATTITSELRALFGAATAQAWTVPQVAERLAMSEATLRRRLNAEGTGFVELLADVRMSHAMTLLQSTDRPVAHIASAVGYESASRFAIRFRERFGFAPTAIRGHRRAGA
jgi:AraC-like DNA-binding protein